MGGCGIINNNQLLFQAPQKDREFLVVCRVKFHRNCLGNKLFAVKDGYADDAEKADKRGF